MVAELGGAYYCLGLEDGFVSDSRDIRLALTEILRAAEVDVVLTLPPYAAPAARMDASSMIPSHG